MGNRHSRLEAQEGDTPQDVTPDAAAQTLGYPGKDRQESNSHTNPFTRACSRLFCRISEVFSSPRKRRVSERLRRNRSFAGTSGLLEDSRDSVRSRSPLSPRRISPAIKVANGQTEEDAIRTEHPRMGIEMAEIDTGPEIGIEAQTLLAKSPPSAETTDRLSSMSIQAQETHSYPYLDDSRSLSWIRNNRTMFVMRGLPGSGKSFLVKKIVRAYGAENVAVCSADDYFVQSDGTYEWDQSRLKDAHEACQEKSRSAAQSGTPVVVIDNTHVQYWEMTPYFQAARANGYRVIIADPKTSWRLNAKLLAERNSHNVPQSSLEKRVRSFKKLLHVRPMYFGWFLSARDSRNILEASRRALAQLTESCQEFCDEFGNCDPCQMFNQDAVIDKDTLHCTAKFFKRDEWSQKSTEVYLKRACQSAGTVTPLTVSGFVVTGRTLGARVELSEDQLELYEQDDYELVRHLGLEDEATARPNGNRAHLTLGTKCKEVRAVETGLDTLRALDGTSSQIKELPNLGCLWRNPDGVFHLKLKEVITCDAMFTGFY